MKKTLGMLLLYGIVGLVILPPFAFIVIGILESRIPLATLKDNLNLSYFLNLFMEPAVFTSYFKMNPINVACWGLIGYAIFMLFLSRVGPKEKDKYENSNEYGSHGTARFQTKKEIVKNYYENGREGWFLGGISEVEFSLNHNYATHAVENSSGLNMQVNVIGPPGSNKTTGFVNPNMFYIPYSYKNSKEKPDIIVTDPKGEILAYTGNYLKEEKYDIKIIDFLNLTYGDAVNPLSYIESEEDIMKIATGFVGAASMKDAKSQNADPIWEQGEGLLLAALIAFVVQVYPKKEHTFEKVGQVLSSRNIRDFELAETLFKRHNVTGYGEELWDKFLNLEDKLRSGVVGGLSIKMTLFSLSKVKKITGTNSFDFKQIGRKKNKPLAIFIQMPDEDRTYSPIINTIISMMLKTMYSTARETFSKLPRPVYMILEEIANIGRLPGIEEMLGTMRGRRIYPMMIWQDLVQMKKMFGDSWEGIIARCDTQVYLGVNDQFTAKYISDKLGKTTISIQGKSEKGEGVMSNPGKTQSENHSQRQLMFPDEVERFNNEKFILVQRSKHPVILNKTQYKHWNPGSKISDELELNQLPKVDRLYRNTQIDLEKKEVVASTKKDVKTETIKENEETHNEEEQVIKPIMEPYEAEALVEEMLITDVEEEVMSEERPNAGIEEEAVIGEEIYEDEEYDPFEAVTLPISEIDNEEVRY